MKISNPNKSAQFQSSSFSPAPRRTGEANTVARGSAPASSGAGGGTRTAKPGDTFDAKRVDVGSFAKMTGADVPAPSREASTEASSTDATKEAQIVEVTGEEQAKKAITIPSVTDQRQQTETSLSQLQLETRNEVETIFAYAQNLKALPENSEIHPTNDPNKAEMWTYDDAGKLQAITTATKLADGSVQLDTVRVKDDDSHERDVVLIGADGSSTVQHADWKHNGAALDQAPTIEALKETWDPDVVVTENQVRHEGANLKTSQYVQVGGGAQQSETVFSKANLDDIDDDDLNEELQDVFKASIESDPNKDPTLDVAVTSTYVVHPPRPEGSEEEVVPPLFTQTTSYSWPGVQATSVATKLMDTDDLDIDDNLEKSRYTAQDLQEVIESFRDEDGEEDIQDEKRQWTLEKSTSDSYSSQTFQEGNEEASIVLNRSVQGATVTETYSGKTFSPDGKDLVNVSGNTTRTYAEDGSVQSLSSTIANADGSTTKTEYQSTQLATAKGLEVSEQLTSVNTNAQMQTHTTEQKTNTLITADGPKLVSASAKTTGPDGTQAHSVVDETGEKLTLIQNGQELAITEASQLPNDPNVQELALQANIATAQTIKDYASNGGAKALELMRLAGSVDLSPAGNPVGFDKLFALGNNVFGKDAVRLALQGSAGVASAAGGVASVVAGGLQVFQAVRNENIPQIIQGLVNAGLGGYNAYKGGVDFVNAIRGIEKAVPISTSALKIPTWFQKVPGLSRLGQSAGVLRVLKAVKALGGIGTVLGVGLGAFDMIDGLRKGDWAKVAKGGVGIASTIGGAIVSGAVAGSVGGPLGALAGILVAGSFTLAGWLVNKGIDALFGPDRDMAPVAI